MYLFLMENETETKKRGGGGAGPRTGNAPVRERGTPLAMMPRSWGPWGEKQRCLECQREFVPRPVFLPGRLSLKNPVRYNSCRVNY